MVEEYIRGYPYVCSEWDCDNRTEYNRHVFVFSSSIRETETELMMMMMMMMMMMVMMMKIYIEQ